MARRGTRECASRFDKSIYEWRVWTLWAPQDQRKPHLGVLSVHGHVAEEHRLLRSEVLALAHLSMIRLKFGFQYGYVVCPVRP